MFQLDANKINNDRGNKATWRKLLWQLTNMAHSVKDAINCILDWEELKTKKTCKQFTAVGHTSKS